MGHWRTCYRLSYISHLSFTVRFITRRFIGEYAPLLECAGPLRVLGSNVRFSMEKVYCCTKLVDGDEVAFELLDSARQEGYTRLEENIKWADGYILMYSVTDQCSFNECYRLKFLINSYSKNHRKSSLVVSSEQTTRAPVFLVGNQNDCSLGRMVSYNDGKMRSEELGCTSFYEISVRESVDCALVVLKDLFFCYKMFKNPRYVFTYSRSMSDEESGDSTSPTLPRRECLETCVMDTLSVPCPERDGSPHLSAANRDLSPEKIPPLATRRHALLTIG